MDSSHLIHISSQSCPQCGATGIPVNDQMAMVTCSYCGTELSIIRPAKVQDELQEILSAEEQKRYKNLINILENSMAAGNYREAYDYCNKALEINPTSGEIWMNKATCAYWRTPWQTQDLDNIINSAREVTTYVSAAKQQAGDSEYILDLSRAIATSMFNVANRRVSDVQPDLEGNRYSDMLYHWVIVHVTLMDVAFEVYPNTLFLKTAVAELTGNGQINWPSIINWFPKVPQMTNEYIVRIRQTEPNYVAPEPKRTSELEEWIRNPGLWIGVAVGVAIIVYLVGGTC